MDTTEQQWAIIELMGHQQIAGRYQEAAGGMHRVDVPADEPNQYRFTRLYSPAAIYSITFVDEASARTAAKILAPRPITVYGFEAELRRLAALAKPGETLDQEYLPHDTDDFQDDTDEFDDFVDPDDRDR